MLIPKFIPMPISALEDGYWLVEACIIGYLDFYQIENDDFSVTNEELSELLHMSESTVKRALKNLNEDWIIEISKNFREWGWILRKIKLTENGLLLCSKMNHCKGSNWPLHNINQQEKKNNKKEKNSTPSVSELVEAYKNDDILPQKMNDENLIRERAEYKQSKKDRAYKTTRWFLQQLNVCIDTIRFWSIRWDTAIRFSFALNQAMEREWKSMYRTEQTEHEYQNYKKTLSLTK